MYLNTLYDQPIEQSNTKLCTYCLKQIKKNLTQKSHLVLINIFKL